MRNKKAAPHNPKHCTTSSPKQPGLTVNENKRRQSARTESALDNHFHRTALPPYRRVEWGGARYRPGVTGAACDTARCEAWGDGTSGAERRWRC